MAANGEMTDKQGGFTKRKHIFQQVTMDAFTTDMLSKIPFPELLIFAFVTKLHRF